MWLILYIVWGVVIISSQVFGHLRSFKGWDNKYKYFIKTLYYSQINNAYIIYFMTVCMCLDQ